MIGVKSILKYIAYFSLVFSMSPLTYAVAEVVFVDKTVLQKIDHDEGEKKMDSFHLQTENVEAQDVLTFWFGEAHSPEYGKPRAMWFQKNLSVDQAIITRFGQLHKRASQGELKDWEKDPVTLLALIILLDQFSRHIYRNEAQAFSTDTVACALSIQAIEQGFDQKVIPIARVFYYLPLEHSENIIDQARSVALFTALYEENPLYQEFLTYAQKHYDIIAQFGRFPHRNQVLRRVSSHAEEKYLKESGTVF